MKTLDEFIKRGDYKRANEQLVAKCINIAEIIRKKMWQLDECEIVFKDITLYISTCKSRSGYSYSYLSIYDDETDKFLSLEHTQDEYFAGDFNCKIEAATNKHYIKFANACKDIIAQLDELETEKTEECDNALNNL